MNYQVNELVGAIQTLSINPLEENKDVSSYVRTLKVSPDRRIQSQCFHDLADALRQGALKENTFSEFVFAADLSISICK
jgi:hypothetical protein